MKNLLNFCVKGIELNFVFMEKQELTQEMVDACLSFIYNVGGGNFGSSTLVKKLNQKDYCGAGDEFLRWNKAAGKVLNGLTKRRNREKDLFLS